MKMTNVSRLLSIMLALMALTAVGATRGLVDYVNPYMGNISHLLKPTYPTVHLPYGMLRFYPNRASHVESMVGGLPLIVVNHRENTCFTLSATQVADGQLHRVMRTDYDNELITPYYYRSDLDEQRVVAELSPMQHSAVVRLQFIEAQPGFVILEAGNGDLKVSGRQVEAIRTHGVG